MCQSLQCKLSVHSSFLSFSRGNSRSFRQFSRYIVYSYWKSFCFIVVEKTNIGFKLVYVVLRFANSPSWTSSISLPLLSSEFPSNCKHFWNYFSTKLLFICMSTFMFICAHIILNGIWLVLAQFFSSNLFAGHSSMSEQVMMEFAKTRQHSNKSFFGKGEQSCQFIKKVISTKNRHCAALCFFVLR